MKGHNCFMKVGESYTDSLCTGSVCSVYLDCAFLISLPSVLLWEPTFKDELGCKSVREKWCCNIASWT